MAETEWTRPPRPRVAGRRKLRGPGTRRRATAVVELALCLPVLVLLVIGAIELSTFIHLKQSLTSAAYESVREAVRRRGTDATATAAADQVLTPRRLSGWTVSISPGANVARGTRVTVTVTAPSSANRAVLPRFVNGLSASAQATMLKE